MGKGLPRSMARGDALQQEIIKQKVAIKHTVTVDGATGVGWGTAVIGDFPEGNILLLGAVSYVTFSGPGSASLTDTFDGDYGIGTQPADDATMTGNDVNLIPSTALGAATAEASPRVRGASAGTLAGTILDNTDGSLEINLNLLIDDASISGDDIAIAAAGELQIVYVMLGDD